MHLSQPIKLQGPHAALWEAAREVLALMASALGGPALIATMGKLERRTRRNILDWLAPLEVLVRKLLLLEAALVPRRAEAKFRKGAPPQRAAPPRGKCAPPHPEKPPTWRVAFSLSASAPRKPARNAGPRIRDLNARYTPPPLKPARPRRDAALKLAMRYEALRRVLDNPAPHARRLARRLERHPPAARRIAGTPAPRRHRGFADDLLSYATTLALGVAGAFDTS